MKNARPDAPHVNQLIIVCHVRPNGRQVVENVNADIQNMISWVNNVLVLVPRDIMLHKLMEITYVMIVRMDVINVELTINVPDVRQDISY